MNRSFEHVIRSPLNHSQSKETHLFGHQKRFLQPRKSNCVADSYDLSRTMIASVALQSKSTLFGKDSRFRTQRSVSPSPDAYHHRSFADINSSLERGNVFGNDRKLKRIDKTNAPGPGAYQTTYNPQKKLVYTIRNRVNIKDHSSKVGPGQYQIDNYNSVAQFRQVDSKYNNTKSIKLGRDARFKDKWHQTPGPGPVEHSGSRAVVGSDPRYSFGGQRKKPSYIKLNNAPGPGSYNQFSQFSELVKGGSTMSKSNRLISYQ